MTSAAPAVRAVIFDWGGTLTPWRTVDFELEARALAAAALDGDDDAHHRLGAAVQTVWVRSRDQHTSATVADIFAEAGLTHDESLLVAYRDFWAPHTLTDPDVLPLFSRLRLDGIKVGVLSNTVWPRVWHEELFERDGVLNLIDGAVYTSEIAWTKPSPKAFRAAMQAVGEDDPAAWCSWGTGSSTTSGARPPRGCGPSTCRTATFPSSRSGTPRASRTRSSSSSPTSTTWCRRGAAAGDRRAAAVSWSRYRSGAPGNSVGDPPKDSSRTAASLSACSAQARSAREVLPTASA